MTNTRTLKEQEEYEKQMQIEPSPFPAPPAGAEFEILGIATDTDGKRWLLVKTSPQYVGLGNMLGLAAWDTVPGLREWLEPIFEQVKATTVGVHLTCKMASNRRARPAHAALN